MIHNHLIDQLRIKKVKCSKDVDFTLYLFVTTRFFKM